MNLFKEEETFFETQFLAVYTIMERNVGTVCPILLKKVSQLSPNSMLIRVMLPEAVPGCPTLIDGGGEGYNKWGVRWPL